MCAIASDMRYPLLLLVMPVNEDEEMLDGKVINATWSMILGVENELGVMNVGSEKITTAITTKFIIVVVNILMFTNIRQ